MEDFKQQLHNILTPELLSSVYGIRFPYAKGRLPTGAVVGKTQFRPEHDYRQNFYDLVYHDALLPMSKMPLEELLAIDLTQLLPSSVAEDYPEQSLGLVTLLDHTRMLTTGYSFRYTRAFFDPLCEKLCRQLISMPLDARPDGKNAWLSRGYSVEDWLVRTLWFWTPLVHADKFMVSDRQTLKNWVHAMRSEVEVYSGLKDPFAAQEAEDDTDINAFQRIETEGPPSTSYANPTEEATVFDYSFWWIRILNAHFAITDMCGHYPYWIRWNGLEWTERDKEFMDRTNNYRYPKDEQVLQQVRNDVLDDVWSPMQPNPQYESRSSHTQAPQGSISKHEEQFSVGRGLVAPPGRSMMPQ